MGKFLRILILFFILIPVNTKALLCDNKEKTRFQELAKNIATTYNYNEINGSVRFNITFSNIPEGFIIKDYNNEVDHYYSASEITLSGYEPGKSYRFDYYTNDIFCEYDKLYTAYINLPYYNPYYNDPICEGLDYKYCNKWYRMNLSYDDFIKDVNKYIDSLKVEEKPVEDIEGLFDKIIEFYVNYYYIILPLVILSGIIGTIYYNKKHDLF